MDHSGPEAQPTDVDASGAEAEAVGGASAPPAKKRLPRGPRVFGKYAWVILLAPYVAYLGGLMLASYIERARAHGCVKGQTEIVLQRLGELNNALDPEFGPRGLVEFYGAQAVESLKSELKLDALGNYLSSGEDLKLEKLKNLARGVCESDAKIAKTHMEAAQTNLNFLLQLLAWEMEGKEREILAAYSARYSDITPAVRSSAGADASRQWFPADRTWYPSTYTIVLALTSGLMLLVSPGYFKAPFRVTIWSIVVGVVGIFVWVGLWWLDKQYFHLGNWLATGAREAFNPYEELKSDPRWMKQFLAIRFAGLVLVVPIVEEFFLRGWLMRYIDDPAWDEIPLGLATRLSIIGVAIYGAISHPAEPLAAVAWFSMVTWLYLKTKSIWDCVVAHTVTNLLLGLFVIWTGSWDLW